MPRRRVQLITPGADGNWGAGFWGAGAWGGSDRVYDLPGGLRLKEDSNEARIDKAKLVFAHGRKSTGGEVDDKAAVVEGYIETDTREQMVDLLRYLKYIAFTSKRLRINPGHFLNLTFLTAFEADDEQGFDGTAKNLRIEWQCDDPFWYSETLQTRSFEMSGDGSFAIDLTDLPACDQGNHPLIKLTSPLFLPVTTAQIANASDGGLQFSYGDPGLKMGNYASIDCVAGTAFRSDGTDTLRYLLGEFIRLVPGVNTLNYVGPMCTIDVTWRPRWL